MTCYHCKKTIKPKERSCYVAYWLREHGPMHRRRWCETCNTDEIIDAEAPKSWDDEVANEQAI